MKTRSYTIALVAIQLISAVALIINLITVAYSLYCRDLNDVESVIGREWYLKYFSYGIYMLLGNILILLFGNCSITSGKKFFMKVYYTFSFLWVIGSILFAFYFKILYMDSFNTGLTNSDNMNYITMKFSTNGAITTPMESIRLVTDKMNGLLDLFIKSEYVTIICLLIIMLLIKYTISIRLEMIDSLEEPPIMEVSKIGLNTKSVNDRHVVDLAI